MIRKRQLSVASLALAIVMTVCLVATPAAALQATERANSVGTHAAAQTQTTVERQAAIQARAQGKLDEAKKKICTNRTNAIKNIMSRAGETGQRHLTLFETTYNRLMDFYTKKKLNITNYDALKANVQTKHAAAVDAVATVKNSQSLDCNGDNPVGAADQFKAKVKTMQSALKEYRASIVTLLNAVKTAAKTAQGGA